MLPNKLDIYICYIYIYVYIYKSLELKQYHIWLVVETESRMFVEKITCILYS